MIFSFISAIKSNRLEMLKVFSDNFPNNYVKTGQTNWSEPYVQNVKPADMHKNIQQFNLRSNRKRGIVV